MGTADGVFATKKAFSIGPVGSTYVFTAFMQSVGNGGYSGMGFTAAEPSAGNSGGYPFRPNDALGMSVHGGGFVFHDGATDASGSWNQGGTSSGITAVTSAPFNDLLNNGSSVDWYKVVLTASRDSLTTFDMNVKVFPTDVNGNTLDTNGSPSTSPSAEFTFNDRSATDLINAPIIYAYFNFSGDRVYNFDNFSVNLGGGASVIDPGYPVVVTTGVSATGGTITFDGDVTSDGGQPITERGFAYESNTEPTISDNKVTQTGTTGIYTKDATSFPDGTWYVRAYATNANGTSYGAEYQIIISGGAGTGTVADPVDNGGGGGGGGSGPDVFDVSAENAGTPITTIEQNDSVDVVTHAPVDYVGEATQTITTTWSTQSLSIDNVNDVTYPAGWGLEYTTDGTTWSGTAPGSLSTVAGVRASGTVNQLEAGLFTSSAEAESVDQISEFNANTGGDGFNVGFGNGILVNSFHHTVPTTISCHYLDGTACGANVSFTGYESTQNSSVFMDKTNDHMYQFVRRQSDGDYGILCVDFSDETDPVACSTPFTTLSDGVVTGLSQASSNSLGAPSKDGTRLWSSESAHNVLLCFDMQTQAACPDGDNGFAIGGTPAGSSNAGLYQLRVAVRAGIVFYTTVDHKMGCYDSSTHALCGGNSPIAINAGNRATPVLIENTSGTFIGACDASSQRCLSTGGTSMTIPSGLSAFWTATATRPNYYIANVNALDYGITKHRLYWGGPQQPDNWSKNITCFDYLRDAPCDGFEVLATNNGSISKVYAASIDSDNPKCIWINQDTGKIVPLNYKTGAIGCSTATSREAFIPITANVDRLGCAVGNEVLTWDSLTITLPDGLTAADVTVNVNDSEDVALVDWQDVTLDEGGVIDLSSLDVADSGTNPIVHIIETDGGPSVDLSATTADVLYSAGAPEVCVALDAVTQCSGITPDPASLTVPDGIIKGESQIEPSNEDDSVSDDETITLTGTNTEDVCAAALPGNPPDPPTDVSVTPGNGTATVSWTAPSDGAAPTSYTVSDVSGLHTCTVDAPATSCEIEGLSNGYPYVFHVVSQNGAGDSDPSSNAAAAIPTAPYSGNTLTIYFTSISPKLSAYNQSLISDFINDHSFKRVTCTGSTQGLETILWLAKARADNSCDYGKTIKKFKSAAVISKNKGIVAPLRSVVLVGK